MKKVTKLILVGLLMISVGLLAGCKKDNPSPNGTGGGSSSNGTPTYELRFTCTSDNPYLIEVDGNSDIIQGNSYKTYYLEKGTYSWKVTQQSGYVFYPTVKDGTVNLNADKEIVFP